MKLNHGLSYSLSHGRSYAHSNMDEDDEFGDLYSDVLQPFQPPPPPPLRSIDLNLRSEDQVAAEPNPPPVARVSATTTTHDANRKSINNEGKEMNFDIEEDSTPTIPGLATTDRQATAAKIEQDVGDKGYYGGQGDDWEDSDSEDDLQIVLNDNSNNVMMGRARMRGNEEEEEDDDDEEQPLVIVTDADPNQAMDEQQQLWGEEGVEGDGKEGEGVKGSGVAAGVKAGGGYSSHGYHHPFHSQFKVSVNCNKCCHWFNITTT